MFRDLFPKTLLQWAGPVLTCVLAALLLAVLVIASGISDLSASMPHPEGWATILHVAFKRSVAHHADPRAVPADLDTPSMVEKGAAYYATACAHCHGAPGVGQNPVALMMRPRPQYLPAVVGEFTPAELGYIVRHGVKYSAMPAWPAQSRPDEVWPIVAFLRAMPKLRYARFRALAYGDGRQTPTDAAIPPFAPPTRPTTYALHRIDQPSDAEHLYAAPVFGFDSGGPGDSPIVPCARCHGADGRGRAQGRMPDLTIQTPTYLYDSLIAFARGTRKSGYMQTVATQLSRAQMAALARYYGNRPAAPGPAPQPGIDPARKKEGARIAAYGIAGQGAGGCTNCHGITKAIGKAIPRLEGQGYGYLVDQMRAFRTGGRGSTRGINPMGAVAHRLTDHQVAAIAAYYAATPPGADAVPTARAAAR